MSALESAPDVSTVAVDKRALILEFDLLAGKLKELVLYLVNLVDKRDGFGKGNIDKLGRESVSQGNESLGRRGEERNTQPMKKEILLCGVLWEIEACNLAILRFR
uniref:Uncharacterized protein n=1 Tax=Salix viminalis TaxID=40686 RepID=A0A6N2N5V5_SALVM